MFIREEDLGNGQCNINLLAMVMKKKLKYGFIILTLLLGNFRLPAQDLEFSQYYTAKFNIAPSFAGTSEDGRLTLITRDQWPLLKNAFLTYGFAVDYSLSGMSSGLGAYATQDYSNGGGYVITNTGIQYSYAAKLSPKWQFRPGLQITAVNKRIDLNKLTFGSQLTIDGTTGNLYPVNIASGNVTNFEAAVSILFYSDATWIGINADHIPFTQNSFSGESAVIPVKFTSFGGILLKKIQGRLLYDRSYFYFSYLFKYQYQFKQLDLGCYWAKYGWEVGVWYRGLPFIRNNYGEFNNSALVFKGGIEFNYLTIGYSFDYPLTSIGIATGGAHEVSMVYLFNRNNDVKKKKRKAFPYPRF